MTDHPISSAHGFTEGSDEVGGAAEQRCVTCGVRQSEPCRAEEPACRFDMRARTTRDPPGKSSLRAIMEAAGRATPGPWHRSGWLVETENAGSTSYQTVAVCFGEWSSGTAAFIATARNNIASVAALVASLEAERDAAKAENDRLREIASKIVAVDNMFRKASSVVARMMLDDAADDARAAVGGDNG